MDEDAWNADELIKRLEDANRRSRKRTILTSVLVVVIFLAAAFQSKILDASLAYYHGVEFNSYEYGRAQMEMWHKNADCSQAPYNPTPRSDGRKIQVEVCASGDIFIRYQMADGRTLYRWISADSLIEHKPL